MHAGNLQPAAGRIQEAYDQLSVAWELARQSWSDQNAQAFEDQTMRQIAETISRAFPSISQLSQTFGQAGRECNE